jgi:beta-glucosidase
VTVSVTNTGTRAGQEVVQLYTRQPVASRSRPMRQLKGFAKIGLDPGQSRDVSLTLRAADLGFHDDAARYRVEPGAVDIYLGGSSLAVLKTQVNLTAR